MSFSQRYNEPDDDAINDIEDVPFQGTDDQPVFEDDCMELLETITEDLLEIRKKLGIPRLLSNSNTNSSKSPAPKKRKISSDK